MDPQERASFRSYGKNQRTSTSISLSGWLVIDVADWMRFNVLLKRCDGLFQYQCTCTTFAAYAPRPCTHVLSAVTAAIKLHALDAEGNLIASSPTFPSSPAVTHAAKRPIAGLGKDGSIRLISIGGKAVASEPTPVPWKPHFATIRATLRASEAPAPWPANRELIFVIDAGAVLEGKGVVLDTMTREPKLSGVWRKPVPFSASAASLGSIPGEQDREIVSRLVGGAVVRMYNHEEPASRRILTNAQAQSLLPILCATGRCLMRHPGMKDVNPTPLQWDAGEPWILVLDVVRDQSAGWYRIGAHLQRGEEKMDLRRPVVLTMSGHVYLHDRIAMLNDFGAFAWIAMLRDRGEIRVPLNARGQLVAELYRSPRLPRLNLPPELEVEHVTVEMRPMLRLIKATPPHWARDEQPKIRGELTFDYGGVIVKQDDAVAMGILQPKEQRLIRRDTNAEACAIARLYGLGFKDEYDHGSKKNSLQVSSRHLPNIIRQLTEEKWYVEAEGKLYRQPGTFSLEVSSGIDWFDLTAKVDFGGQSASLPALLAAVRKGEQFVRLDDGTFGMLPEEWLKKYGGLAEIGTVEDDRVRFKRTQVGLLDALLASQPAATCDETFRRTREELRAFDGVAPQEPPATFTGDLRPYQKDALGWFGFLRKFGFGGCLADDMGLGKTVQVLALLEARRIGDADSKTKATAPRRPTLVVVPRSLVFNWKQESARFAPSLRVLDHTQPNRPKEIERTGDYDLIVSTYGTLRRDAAYLKDVKFDYLILDEAQAVKNPASESAKAVRLLQGAHRLVLTGTPVQNHLGDLWSLFDFLNPGMLGAVSAFSAAGSNGLTPDDESRVVLSKALRPFILRRTKEQVAKDLPAKLEQTIYCEMEPPQRKLYDELREHYRQSLLSKIQKHGLAKSKIQILEALLRLRQAACHPGLIDKARADDPSAKLDMLLPRLIEAQDEGHKVLVFSQFTSFLSLLRTRLNKEKIVYEYLDGKTRDRQARVERFQTDPDCKLFLISLKAGGVGLNLTAADYVFLLDPWWNPAIEAQAIDRTHRIGQTRQVFACRLITKDTVEEKVLMLQQSKRELADAIINADNSLIRTIGREDLELLLT